MDLETMTRDELIAHIRELNDYMDNVVVFWGGRREFLATFTGVAENSDKEYTEEEAANAAVIVQDPGAFDEFIQMVRDSFDHGGIDYMLSEKISALMEEVAGRRRKIN